MSGNGSLFAVVTGASSGIGYYLARVFAENGYDLLVTAEDEKINTLLPDFDSFGVQVQSVQIDLADYEGVEELWSAIERTGRDVDAIAINEGVGVGGDFARETELDDELNLIQLNVASTVHLAKRVLAQMIARGKGRILFTSSIAADMPTSLEAVYGASKAFVQSFAHSLRTELKDTGITVTALQPGPTDTNFFHRAGLDDTEVGTKGKNTNDPEEVARQGYAALMEGKDHVYASSLTTKLEGEVGKYAPEPIKAERHKKMAQPLGRK